MRTLRILTCLAAPLRSLLPHTLLQTLTRACVSQGAMTCFNINSQKTVCIDHVFLSEALELCGRPGIGGREADKGFGPLTFHVASQDPYMSGGSWPLFLLHLQGIGLALRNMTWCWLSRVRCAHRELMWPRLSRGSGGARVSSTQWRWWQRWLVVALAAVGHGNCNSHR